MGKLGNHIINLKIKSDDFMSEYKKACNSTNKNVQKAKKGSFLMVLGLCLIILTILK